MNSDQWASSCWCWQICSDLCRRWHSAPMWSQTPFLTSMPSAWTRCSCAFVSMKLQMFGGELHVFSVSGFWCWFFSSVSGEDLERNDGSSSRPYYMSSGLHEILHRQEPRVKPDSSSWARLSWAPSPYLLRTSERWRGNVLGLNSETDGPRSVRMAPTRFDQTRRTSSPEPFQFLAFSLFLFQFFSAFSADSALLRVNPQDPCTNPEAAETGREREGGLTCSGWSYRRRRAWLNLWKIDISSSSTVVPFQGFHRTRVCSRGETLWEVKTGKKFLDFWFSSGRFPEYLQETSENSRRFLCQDEIKVQKSFSDHLLIYSQFSLQYDKSCF